MQQRQCEVCRQLESERGFRRASREASETDRSKEEWRKRRRESRGTRLERDFSSLCCSRAAGASAAAATTAAVASPPTCSSRPWHGPFQCVCWFNLWPPRSSNSPGLFAISDKCVWPSTMGRLRHTHSHTLFPLPVLVSSSQFQSRLQFQNWMVENFTVAWLTTADQATDHKVNCTPRWRSR